MSLPEISKDNIVGIDEICYRLHCSRSQFFVWRRDPSFPPVQKTRHGLKGYDWPSVVQWVVDNRQRLRRCAGRPNFDGLAASLQVPVRDHPCDEPATSERKHALGMDCEDCNLRETVSTHLRTTR